MADLEVQLRRAPVAGGGLACRLRRMPGEMVAGEVVLKNKSTAPLEIEFQASLLQYLDLQVSDMQGTTVSEWFYGDSFSPSAETHVLRLQPGETFTGAVSLLGNVPLEARRAGKYTVQARFQYETIRTASDPIEIEYGLRSDDSRGIAP